jgi:predicted nucleic acid-binding protein
MVLVDTSVWARFLNGKEPYARELDRLLAADDVLGHGFVYGELLIGDRGGRAKLLVAYAKMHQAPFVSHADVVDLVKSRKLHGLGIGWVDAHLLASAVVERCQFWTADESLAATAEILGVQYAAGASG